MEDDLTRRLRALGDQAVPPATSAAHLAAMADAGAPRDRRRFGRIAVGLAALTGFLVGGSGLAMAGALPAPAQDAAAGVLAQVGLDAPRPASSEYGRCVSDAAKLHGEDEEDGANDAFKAAKEVCEERKAVKGGKGPKEGKGPGDGKGPKEGKGPQSTPPAQDDDLCTGPPPWAGQGGGPTAAERGARTLAKQSCPPEADD